MGSEPDLLPLLSQYFGFTSFRPRQEEIIRDVLRGRDVLAILPTGGGKSLCFQLPALARPGLAVVVSPLISLMKDQVDALQAAGVPATFLNSSLSGAESGARFRGLQQGQYRLLYVAPERLMLPDFLATLQRWKITLLAIDEAHCISEWGHDFRPEYRQLGELQRSFPQAPLLALTATATQRVRDDIVALLKLRTPSCYIASFNRPNLTYRVQPKDDPHGQVLELVNAKEGESGIVYCQSRKGAERLAEWLREDGIAARSYHAGLDAKERTLHQELFLRDEVRVICATIAFGMGINKPNVRFVIHHDLPKNIEGYYQETGRAGRDGLPAECLLLFSRGDVAKQMHFIGEITNPREKETATRQLWRMVEYAECAGCRRGDLLRYFGETQAETNCAGCDNCLEERLTYDGTVEAQKLLSCVYRIHKHSGFNCGIGHAVDVLRGADTENIRRRGHEKLTTYGIGREHTEAEWRAIGRELIRLGLLAELANDKFTVVALNQAGLDVLTQRKPVRLTEKQKSAGGRGAGARERGAVYPQPQASISNRQAEAGLAARRKTAGARGAIECDEALFARLRTLRKRLADERKVPAYIVFSDVTLRQMARDCPLSEQAFRRISGVGDKKCAEYAEVFISEMLAYGRGK